MRMSDKLQETLIKSEVTHQLADLANDRREHKSLSPNPLPEGEGVKAVSNKLQFVVQVRQANKACRISN